MSAPKKIQGSTQSVPKSVKEVPKQYPTVAKGSPVVPKKSPSSVAKKSSGTSGLIDSLQLTEDNIMKLTGLSTAFSRSVNISGQDLDDGAELDRKTYKRKVEVILGTKTEKAWVKTSIEKDFYKKVLVQVTDGNGETSGDPDDGNEEEEDDEDEDGEANVIDLDSPPESAKYESFQD